MTEILFSEKHLAESVRHGSQAHAMRREQYRFPSRTAENRSMLCRVVRVRDSERQSCKGCKQGGTVGKRSPLRDTGVSAFLLLCSNGKLKMES